MTKHDKHTKQRLDIEFFKDENTPDNIHFFVLRPEHPEFR